MSFSEIFWIYFEWEFLVLSSACGGNLNRSQLPLSVKFGCRIAGNQTESGFCTLPSWTQIAMYEDGALRVGGCWRGRGSRKQNKPVWVDGWCVDWLLLLLSVAPCCAPGDRDTADNVTQSAWTDGVGGARAVPRSQNALKSLRLRANKQASSSLVNCQQD